MEIYRFVRNHPSVIYDIQSAIVDFPENNHQETAAKNAGLALWKWFTDLDSARAWLKASKRSSAETIFQFHGIQLLTCHWLYWHAR